MHFIINYQIKYIFFFYLFKCINKVKLNRQQEYQEEQDLAKQLGITVRFAKYLLKNVGQYDRNRKASQLYQGMQNRIDNLTKLFHQYEIDGLIQYKNANEDSFTKFCEDIGIENDTILQLYITYKFQATKGAKFQLNEFILGMIRLKCDTIQQLQLLMPSLKIKIQEENKYQKLYKYYFYVISKMQNTIKFSDAILLWESLLKEQFQFITEFLQFCRAKSPEYLAETRVSFDLWCQVWKFFETFGEDYSQFDENDAWPVLIFDYVQFKRKG